MLLSLMPTRIKSALTTRVLVLAVGTGAIAGGAVLDVSSAKLHPEETKPVIRAVHSGAKITYALFIRSIMPYTDIQESEF